jgi:hypothetical protein
LEQSWKAISFVEKYVPRNDREAMELQRVYDSISKITIFDAVNDIELLRNAITEDNEAALFVLNAFTYICETLQTNLLYAFALFDKKLTSVEPTRAQRANNVEPLFPPVITVTTEPVDSVITASHWNSFLVLRQMSSWDIITPPHVAKYYKDLGLAIVDILATFENIDSLDCNTFQNEQEKLALSEMLTQFKTSYSTCKIECDRRFKHNSPHTNNNDPQPTKKKRLASERTPPNSGQSVSPSTPSNTLSPAAPSSTEKSPPVQQPKKKKKKNRQTPPDNKSSKGKNKQTTPKSKTAASSNTPPKKSPQKPSNAKEEVFSAEEPYPNHEAIVTKVCSYEYLRTPTAMNVVEKMFNINCMHMTPVELIKFATEQDLTQFLKSRKFKSKATQALLEVYVMLHTHTVRALEVYFQIDLHDRKWSVCSLPDQATREAIRSLNLSPYEILALSESEFESMVTTNKLPQCVHQVLIKLRKKFSKKERSAYYRYFEDRDVYPMTIDDPSNRIQVSKIELANFISIYKSLPKKEFLKINRTNAFWEALEAEVQTFSDKDKPAAIWYKIYEKPVDLSSYKPVVPTTPSTAKQKLPTKRRTTTASVQGQGKPLPACRMHHDALTIARNPSAFRCFLRFKNVSLEDLRVAYRNQRAKRAYVGQMFDGFCVVADDKSLLYEIVGNFIKAAANARSVYPHPKLSVEYLHAKFASTLHYYSSFEMFTGHLHAASDDKDYHKLSFKSSRQINPFDIKSCINVPLDYDETRELRSTCITACLDLQDVVKYTSKQLVAMHKAHHMDCRFDIYVTAGTSVFYSARNSSIENLQGVSINEIVNLKVGRSEEIKIMFNNRADSIWEVLESDDEVKPLQSDDRLKVTVNVVDTHNKTSAKRYHLELECMEPTFSFAKSKLTAVSDAGTKLLFATILDVPVDNSQVSEYSGRLRADTHTKFNDDVSADVVQCAYKWLVDHVQLEDDNAISMCYWMDHRFILESVRQKRDKTYRYKDIIIRVSEVAQNQIQQVEVGFESELLNDVMNNSSKISVETVQPLVNQLVCQMHQYLQKFK